MGKDRSSLDMDAQSQRAQERIVALRQEIEEANYRYHTLSQPTISDTEYDALVRELEDLERSHPEFLTAESPTATVAPAPSKAFDQISHLEPMLGLSNAYDMGELEAWDGRIRSLLPLGELRYVAELKIDGLAAALRYENGGLVSVATRGDGAVGEDVTANALTIPSIPRHLADAPPVLEVRCEVFMPRKGFLRLNEQRAKEHQPEFANPRNAAAGAVRQQDPAVTASRPLDLFAFGISNATHLGFQDQWQVLAALSRWGLPVNENNGLFESLEEVKRFCANWEWERMKLPYESDGIVVKINSLQQQQRLGSIFRSPRWAVAYKFAPLEATSVVRSIFMIVGREGSIIPYASIEPVKVGGATLSVIPLHNQDYIVRKDIRIGDRVIVRRAGDIRPQIVKSLPELRTGEEQPFKWPQTCPACGTAIVRKAPKADWKCRNSKCPGKLYQRIRQYASQEAMDIRGVGEALVSQLITAGLLEDVGDLYKLQENDLTSVGLSTKQAGSALRAIERSKERSFTRLIYGIGIADIGLGMATRLARQFSSMGELGSATLEQLTAVRGIGQKTAEAIVHFFGDEGNQAMLAKLRSAGVI